MLGKYLLIFLILLVFVSVIFPVWMAKRRMTAKPKNTVSSLVRKSAVAGSFYPSDSKELNQQLTGLVNQSEKIPAAGNLRILIVPHAGIQFSGPTAAAGFKQIEGENYKRIIILGASHRASFNHAAVFASGEWETPLGKVAVDNELASAIIDKNVKIIADEEPHREEHSLEIELIFLQKVLKDFKIVPILVSQLSDELVESLAQKIAQNFDKQTLLVVSTDLSHYPPQETAKEVDNQTIGAILSGNEGKFAETVAELEAKSYPNLETAACAYEAIKVGLKIGEILKVNYQKIEYKNSGDVSGDKSKVVGYVAIGGWSEKLSNTGEQLDELAQKEALEIARKTLEEYLSTGKIPSFSPTNQGLRQPLGAFVTLRKTQGKPQVQGELRGCIGEFEPKEPLYQVIQKMAIAAATQDFRFPPVVTEELKEIDIEISVMTPKKKMGDWREIKLGRHGVVVEKNSRSGTFLPQVATETGWSLEEFLAQLCSQKAGLPPDCYKDPGVNLFVFEAQIFQEK